MSFDPALPPPPWPARVDRFYLEEVDSTNTEAFRRVAAAASFRSARDFWVLARRQILGRGRRARFWVSPDGNFYATFLMCLSDPPAQVALRSFVAALALRDALAAVVAQAEKEYHPKWQITLKWPNDLLVKGGKVAGILLESQPRPGGGQFLAVGIGVNLISYPDASSIEPGAFVPVSVLSEMGITVTPECLLAYLAPAFDHWEKRFRHQGFAPIRASWLSSAACLGDVIAARTGDMCYEGIFETVDEHGNLVLKMPKGVVSIPAAEVFF